MSAVPESVEVRRYRWRLEDEAFDRRDALLSRIERACLAAVVVVLVLALAWR